MLLILFYTVGTFLGGEGEIQTGVSCMIEAKARMTDLTQLAAVTSMIAEQYYNLGFINKAIDEEKQTYRIMVEMYGTTDSRTIDCKNRLEIYLRAYGNFTHTLKEVAANDMIHEKEVVNNAHAAAQLEAVTNKFKKVVLTEKDIENDMLALIQQQQHENDNDLHMHSGGGHKKKGSSSHTKGKKGKK